MCWDCTPHSALRDWLDDNIWSRRIFKALLRGQVTTPEQIKAMSDEHLLAIDNIGFGAVQYLRDRQEGHGETLDYGPPPDPRTDAERLAALIEQAMRRQGGGGALP